MNTSLLAAAAAAKNCPTRWISYRTTVLATLSRTKKLVSDIEKLSRDMEKLCQRLLAANAAFHPVPSPSPSRFPKYLEPTPLTPHYWFEPLPNVIPPPFSVLNMAEYSAWIKQKIAPEAEHERFALGCCGDGSGEELPHLAELLSNYSVGYVKSNREAFKGYREAPSETIGGERRLPPCPFSFSLPLSEKPRTYPPTPRCRFESLPCISPPLRPELNMPKYSAWVKREIAPEAEHEHFTPGCCGGGQELPHLAKLLPNYIVGYVQSNEEGGFGYREALAGYGEASLEAVGGKRNLSPSPFSFSLPFSKKRRTYPPTPHCRFEPLLYVILSQRSAPNMAEYSAWVKRETTPEPEHEHFTPGHGGGGRELPHPAELLLNCGIGYVESNGEAAFGCGEAFMRYGEASSEAVGGKPCLLLPPSRDKDHGGELIFLAEKLLVLVDNNGDAEANEEGLNRHGNIQVHVKMEEDDFLMVSDDEEFPSMLLEDRNGWMEVKEEQFGYGEAPVVKNSEENNGEEEEEEEESFGNGKVPQIAKLQLVSTDNNGDVELNKESFRCGNVLARVKTEEEDEQRLILDNKEFPSMLLAYSNGRIEVKEERFEYDEELFGYGKEWFEYGEELFGYGEEEENEKEESFENGEVSIEVPQTEDGEKEEEEEEEGLREEDDVLGDGIIMTKSSEKINGEKGDDEHLVDREVRAKESKENNRGKEDKEELLGDGESPVEDSKYSNGEHEEEEGELQMKDFIWWNPYKERE